MNQRTSTILLQLTLVCTTALAAQSCPAAQKCIDALKVGKPCPLVPLPPSKIPGPIDEQGFNITELRPGVHWYNDGAYHVLIAYKNNRLAIVDFPMSQSSMRPDGTYLVNTAVTKILDGDKPKRVDLVYGHRHLDHIGSAGLVFNFVKRSFPKAKLFVWGTQETRHAVDAVQTIPRPDVIVRTGGRTVDIAPTLKIKLLNIGGHTNEDLAAYVVPSSDGPGVVHFVDILWPGQAPFLRFALTTDVERYIAAQRSLLQLHWKFFLGGHGLLGSRHDIRANIQYTQFVIKAASEAIKEADPKAIQQIFAERDDPASPAFRHSQAAFIRQFRLFDSICVRKVIERWVCELPGVDLFVESHCTTMVLFNLVDNEMLL